LWGFQMKLAEMRKAIRSIQEDIDKKEMPLYWFEFLLMVAEAGDKGILTKEASQTLGMTQGIASRMVRLLSRYHKSEKEHESNGRNKMNNSDNADRDNDYEGLDILQTRQDLHYRHQQRVFLTEKGITIMKRAGLYMT
jgi:DNA-binding MarR family transcriptional regulator